jgi:Glycine-rich domain-containing protein-like
MTISSNLSYSSNWKAKVSNKSNDSASKQLFSSDLVEASQNLLIFLRGIHASGASLAQVTVKAIQRYEKLWLPLVAEHGKLFSDLSSALVPPPDIAWLWHCHRLAPYRYESYCSKRFKGTILEANPPFTFSIEANDGAVINNSKYQVDCTHTLKKWSKAYPDEPFFLPLLESDLMPLTEAADDNFNALQTTKYGTINNTIDTVSSSTVLSDGYDIARSARSQMQFLFQVSHPCYADLAFLEESVIKHHKFLRLKVRDGSMIVPTFQIDLIWHAHMLASTTVYNADCIRIHGSKFNHDDTLDDRSEGSCQQQAFLMTIGLWKRQYYEPYVTLYGNYLGEPPAEYYKPDWDASKQHDMVTNSGTSTDSLKPRAASGEQEKVDRFDERPWLDPLVGTIQNGRIIFLPPKVSEQTKKLHPELRMDDFVYGDGCLGVGHYSLQTRDAHWILLGILQRRITEAESELEMHSHAGVSLFSVIFGKRQNETKEMQQLKADIAYLSLLMSYTKARINAGGPHVKIADEFAFTHDANTSTADSMTTRTANWEIEDDQRARNLVSLSPLCIQNEILRATGGWGWHGGQW